MAKATRSKTSVTLALVAVRDQMGGTWVIDSSLPEGRPLTEGEVLQKNMHPAFMKAEVLMNRMPKAAGAGIYVYCLKAVPANPEKSKALVFHKGKLCEIWQGGFPQAKGSLRIASQVIDQLKSNGITRWISTPALKCVDDEAVFKELGFGSLE
jgi:hypothetical protein